MKRDVELADVEESEWIGDKDTEHAEQQQHDADDLAEPSRVRETGDRGESGDADHDVDEVVEQIDIEEPEELAIGQGYRAA
jgi:hypothetical protein